jgi:hypothetical protein
MQERKPIRKLSPERECVKEPVESTAEVELESEGKV